MVSFPGSTPAGHAGENAYKGAKLENTEPQTQAEAPETVAEEIAEEKAEAKSRRKKANTEPEPEAETEQISVFLSRMVYRNPFTHNSLSVKALQRRLVDLGFVEAGADQAGLFADGTKSAVEEYQAKHDIDSTPGEVDAETLKAIFRNAKGYTLNFD